MTIEVEASASREFGNCIVVVKRDGKVIWGTEQLRSKGSVLTLIEKRWAAAEISNEDFEVRIHSEK